MAMSNSGLPMASSDSGDGFPFYTFPAQLHRIVDGDTQHVVCDLGFSTRQTRNLRLRGIDTAETYGTPKESDEYKTGMEQKRFVEDWYADAASAWDGDWPLAVATDSLGDFGRYLATVYSRASSESLNAVLISEYGDAVRYDG